MLGRMARIVLLPLLLAAGPRARGDEPTAARQQGDLVCGPRCLEYLLRCYHKENPGLIELIREVQWPDIDAGSTLQSLEAALRRRGLGTRAIRIGPEARLCWPYPVLVHLSGTDTEEGHYVVWLPSSTEAHEEVWSGLAGVRTGTPAQLARRRSGAILLTAPGPIGDPGAAIYHRDWFWRRSAALGLGSLVAVLCWLGGRFVSVHWRNSRVRFPLATTKEVCP